MRRKAMLRQIRMRFCEGMFLALALSLLGAAVASAVDAPQQSLPNTDRSKPKSFHATAFVRGGMGIRVIDYWSKGALMRARTLIAGHPILTLVDGERYIAIDLLAGKGVSIRRPASARARDAKRGRPFAFELDDLIRDGGEKIEDKSVGPIDTEIWQVRDGYGRRKVWISAKEPRVPLRVETFSRAAGDTHHLDYSNWVFDLDFPSDFFRPPAGVQLESLEYEEYSVKAAAGTVTRVPILYPDLLHSGETP